jgi:FixJ family two-component response regulator
MDTQTVYIVSKHEAVRDSVKELAESAGLNTGCFQDLDTFLDVIRAEDQGCLVFDARIYDLHDSQLHAKLTMVCNTRPGILITERGDVPMAVSAMRAGAKEIVQKPYSREDLLQSINRALQLDAVEHRTCEYRLRR